MESRLDSVIRAALMIETLSFVVLGLFQWLNGPASKEHSGLLPLVSLSLELVAIWLLLLGGMVRLYNEGFVREHVEGRTCFWRLFFWAAVAPSLWLLTAVV